MEMNLDISESCMNHFGERLQQCRAVFFFGIEKRVLSRSSHCITVPLGNFGPEFAPRLYPFQTFHQTCIAAKRFKMVRDRDENPHGLGVVEFCPPQRAQVPGQPNLSISRELHLYSP